MGINASAYRQQVADFRKRLNDFAQGKVPKGSRVFIDTTGSRSTYAPSRSDLQRFTIYGRRRQVSVARAMALFEFLRQTEELASRAKPVEVEAKGAYWQAFRGTTDSPACHTCPALLHLDGQLPMLMTGNRGLRRHIILLFGDCMKMPALVNKVDRVIDDSVGWAAFERAASLVLNRIDVSWRDGLQAYIEAMRDLFGDMIAVFGRDIQFPDTDTQQRFLACQAFYEGLFLTAINARDMGNYISEVRAEMGVH